MIPNLASEITRQMCEGYLKHIDNVFVKALQDHDLPSTEEFVKANIVCIRVGGDKFDHYWYRHGQPDGKRIISIEHEPTMRLEEPTDLISNYKQVIEAKYY